MLVFYFLWVMVKATICYQKGNSPFVNITGNAITLLIVFGKFGKIKILSLLKINNLIDENIMSDRKL